MQHKVTHVCTFICHHSFISLQLFFSTCFPSLRGQKPLHSPGILKTCALSPVLPSTRSRAASNPFCQKTPKTSQQQRRTHPNSFTPALQTDWCLLLPAASVPNVTRAPILEAESASLCTCAALVQHLCSTCAARLHSGKETSLDRQLTPHNDHGVLGQEG